MQNIAGSLPKHSFNYLGGGENLYVFEAPIDMLSYISMNENTDWHKQNYVALCGTSSHAMVEVLEKNSNINHVNLCLDNDKTGHQTVDRFGKLLREI
ncbi:MAG: toprim domain-containing protein, partial [Clostridia bacterium]